MQGQGPGDGHPLLLAAGELAGQAVQPLLQPQGLDDPAHIVLVHPAPVQLDGQDDIFIGAEHWHQVIGLEHKPDLPPPEDGQFLVLQRENVLPIHQHRATGGAVQPAQDVEQGGFPAP